MITQTPISSYISLGSPGHIEISAQLNLTANLTSIVSHGYGISSSLNLTSTLTSRFEYSIEQTSNVSSFIEAIKEADYAIGDEHLPTPPKFKLLGYTVINEFGSPYITAELKFQGNDIPSKDEYITLTQTDAETGQKKTIFRGFPIEVSWKLKKDLVEANIKAVTNGWYLTQQNPSEWECSTPQAWKISQTWDPDYVYGRMNEIMLLWDYLNRIPRQVDIDGGLTTFPMRPTGFCSWYTTWCAKKVDTKWNMLTGVAPSYQLTDEITDIVNTYLGMTVTPSTYVDIPDCKGVSDEPKEWAFDDFRTTKYDAIMQFSDYCDRIFHTRIAQTNSDLQQYQPPYGYYDKGTLVAYWTRNTSAIANSVEPFSVCLNITALTDNTLIEINKEERDTERTTPNVVKAGSIEPESYYTSDYDRNESTYPCDWWQKSTGEYTECGSYWFRAERPVQHFRMTENLSQNQVETYAQELYERLQKGQDKYTASCLSIVCERTSPYRSILPGSRIRVQNVSNHTDDELRIMRITHKKDGPKPATTEIEYYDVYDLAHPNIFPGSNIIERITAQSEKNAEMGHRIETYQNIKNPRKIGVGSQSFITPVEVTNVSSDLKVAEVRILNTSGKVKNVITW